MKTYQTIYGDHVVEYKESIINTVHKAVLITPEHWLYGWISMTQLFWIMVIPSPVLLILKMQYPALLGL